jgi:hypothetical protein
MTRIVCPFCKSASNYTIDDGVVWCREGDYDSPYAIFRCRDCEATWAEGGECDDPSELLDES